MTFRGLTSWDALLLPVYAPPSCRGTTHTCTEVQRGCGDRVVCNATVMGQEAAAAHGGGGTEPAYATGAGGSRRARRPCSGPPRRPRRPSPGCAASCHSSAAAGSTRLGSPAARRWWRRSQGRSMAGGRRAHPPAPPAAPLGALFCAPTWGFPCGIPEPKKNSWGLVGQETGRGPESRDHPWASVPAMWRFRLCGHILENILGW